MATLLGVDVPTLKSVLTSWGPGKYDAEIFLDGNPTLHAPEVNSSATLIPPAYGLRGVNMHTYTGWGSITQWNAFVAVLEMHGQGSYTDTRLDNSAKFPVAAAPANHMGHTVPPAGQPDLVTSKLGALEFYEQGLNYILELNEQGVDFIERYAAIILKKMLTNDDPGYVDLSSPSGIARSCCRPPRAPPDRRPTHPPLAPRQEEVPPNAVWKEQGIGRRRQCSTPRASRRASGNGGS